MIAFTGAAVLMVAAALGFLLPPLLRARDRMPGASGSDANLEVYRHQVRELEADRDTGVVSAAAFDESRLELERRLVDEVVSSGGGGRTPSGEAQRSVAIVIGIAVPLLSAALYWQFGTPQAILAPPGASAASPHGPTHSTSPEQIDAMIDRLAARLAKDATDGDGWAMLGRSYAVLGRHAEAVPAYERAVALLPDDAQLLADYADALAVSRAGRFEGKPLKLLQRALRLDPENVKALALTGTAAFDRRDYAGAAALWERAVNAAPPEEDFTASLRESLAEARSRAAANVQDRRAPRGSAGSTIAGPRTVSGQVSVAPALVARTVPEDVVLI